jgi:ParB-like chromosome segregation protein Spo0J
MKKTKSYIPSPEYHKTRWAYSAYPDVFKRTDKYPIEKIKFNKKYLPFKNPVRQDTVNSILTEFYVGAWEPIFLNEKGYLIDGQHRLATAKKMKLKYIDVIIVNNSN